MSRLPYLAATLPPLSSSARAVLASLYERQPQSPALLEAATGLDPVAVRYGMAELHAAGVLRGGRRLSGGEPGFVWLDLAAAVAGSGRHSAPSTPGPTVGIRRVVVDSGPHGAAAPVASIVPRTPVALPVAVPAGLPAPSLSFAEPHGMLSSYSPSTLSPVAPSRQSPMSPPTAPTSMEITA